jgi:hypothetical protein
MLIKDRDDRNGAIEQLKDLLALDLSPRKKFLIERELKIINPCDDGGKNVSRFIDFYCADSRNWAVIHDLKIEDNGFSTQIDHILINRFFDVYLVESKNYTYDLKITANGEFFVFDGRKYQSVNSPIEENQKRIQTLSKVLAVNNIIPKRLGIPVRPRIMSYVLVSPGAKVLRPPQSVYDTSSVVSVNYLTETLLKNVESVTGVLQKLRRLPKAFNARTLEKAAAKLASLNSPVPVDYGRLFCPEGAGDPPAPRCAAGRASLTGDFAI